jgi:hypothetical protein
VLDDRYVAGLFDGEGWFQIDRAKRKDCRRGIAFQVHARICMRDRLLLKQLQKQYGGSLRQSSKATAKRAAYWAWDVCGQGVLDFIQRVASYLYVKARQAKLAAEFQRFKQLNGNRPNTDARHARLVRFYARMRLLNRKGISR